jgi:hypothetical protein
MSHPGGVTLFAVMKFLRPQRLAFGLIVLFAMGWAQAFGLHRGFMCDCGGVEQITLVDHCHGPHSSGCHEHEDHSLPHDHEGEDGETHDHAAVVDSLLAQLQQDTGTVFSPPVKGLDAFDFLASVRLIATDVKCMPETPPRSWRQRQEWPRRIAQTIALRI